MDTRTGKIVNIADIPEAERIWYVPVNRDLTAKEMCEKQVQLYAPCGCGSGKKFKFCCHTKEVRHAGP